MYFNPLSPHGERQAGYSRVILAWNFNPLSPHGERLSIKRYKPTVYSISIHSPRMGRD